MMRGRKWDTIINYRLYATEEEMGRDEVEFGRGLAWGFIAVGTRSFNGEVWRDDKGRVIWVGDGLE